MSSEGGFWDTARPVLQGMGLDPHRVENILHGGWPDVDYTHGIIELKNVTDWPVRKGTNVWLNFEVGQVPVLMRRWRAGGLSWVFARVHGSWFLFDGWSSRRLEDGLTQEDFRRAACWSRANGSTFTEVVLKSLKGWLTADEALLMPHERAKLHRLRACKTAEETAREFGWNLGELLDAEAESNLTDDLLAAWES